MTFGSLFAGIGGIDLGLERAGMQCRWQVEIDPFARRVLSKHWPHVPKYPDVRGIELFDDECFRKCATVEPVDVLAGGFPCQDISTAGHGIGIIGSRSGLWTEFARLVAELRPKFVLVENVSALRARGLALVLQDLWALGYDAEWNCIPASAVGAPHERDRIWIVAYPQRSEWREGGPEGCGLERKGCVQIGRYEGSGGPGIGGEAMAYTDGRDQHGRISDVQMGWRRIAGEVTGDGLTGRNEWRTEPDVGRVAYGVPSRLDRLKGLGNAVVPQVVEWIGRRIMAAA